MGYSDVKAYICQLELLHSFLSLDTSFLKLELDRVETSLSPLHGRGVFAKVNIKAYEIVTLYPATNGIGFKTKNDECFFRKVDQETNLMQKYRMNVAKKDDVDIFIEANPSKTPSPCLLGHMINDVSIIDHADISLQKVAKYMILAIQYGNCAAIRLGEGLVAMITTKDISCGDELLFPYGYSYYMTGINIQEKFESFPIETKKKYAGLMIKYEKMLNDRQVAIDQLAAKKYISQNIKIISILKILSSTNIN